MEARIASVEFVNGTPTGSHVALAMTLQEPLALPKWQGLDLADEILEVSDPGTHAP
jgi:hypothetical protein